MTSKYNATVYQSQNGKVIGTFLAQVNENGKMLRSNWCQFTQYDGTEAYDMYLHMRSAQSTFTIVQDGGKGYKDAIAQMMLPPAYR